MATFMQPFQCDLQPQIPKHPRTTHAQTHLKLEATVRTSVTATAFTVLECLHQGCDGHVSADFLKFGADNCPFKCPLVPFLLWRRDSGLELSCLWCFVTHGCRSHCNDCNGCTKVPWCCGCARSSMVFCSRAL